MFSWFSSGKNTQYEMLHKQFTSLWTEVSELNERSSSDLIQSIKRRVFSHDQERARSEEEFSNKQKNSFKYNGKTLAQHLESKLNVLAVSKPKKVISKTVRAKRAARAAKWNSEHVSSDSEDLMSGAESKSSGSRPKPKLKRRPAPAPRRAQSSDEDNMESPARGRVSAAPTFIVGKGLGTTFAMNMDTESEGSSSDSDTGILPSTQLFG